MIQEKLNISNEIIPIAFGGFDLSLKELNSINWLRIDTLGLIDVQLDSIDEAINFTPYLTSLSISNKYAKSNLQLFFSEVKGNTIIVDLVERPYESDNRYNNMTSKNDFQRFLFIFNNNQEIEIIKKINVFND